MTTASTDLSSALTRLQGTLAGLGNFWGDDDQGAKFAEVYKPRATQVADASGNVSHGLSTIGDGLGAMADNMSVTDQSSTSTYANH